MICIALQNKLRDKDNVYDYFMSKPEVLARVNRHVLAKSKVFDLSKEVVPPLHSISFFAQCCLRRKLF